VLELDHVFAMVTDPGQAAARLEDHEWVLDVGQAHRGQGTRNRRLVWPEAYFELLWLTDAAEAAANPLRLDRRAAWTTAGASPFGVAFRGQIESADSHEFWLYDALGPRIWIHRGAFRRVLWSWCSKLTTNRCSSAGAAPRCLTPRIASQVNSANCASAVRPRHP